MCKKTGTANDNKEYESVSQILVKNEFTVFVLTCRE